MLQAILLSGGSPLHAASKHSLKGGYSSFIAEPRPPRPPKSFFEKSVFKGINYLSNSVAKFPQEVSNFLFSFILYSFCIN